MVATHRPCALRWMAGTEIAWLAGLLEGEGCFSFEPGKLAVTLAMTDRDVVERAAAITGVGTVISRRRTKPDRKDQWVWRTRRLRDAAGIMQMIAPYMGARRRSRIEEALTQAHWPTPVFCDDRASEGW